MGVEKPDLGWWEWVWTYVVAPIAGGSAWPLTDEDQVRAKAEEWRALKADLEAYGQDTSMSLNDLAALWHGPDAEAFRLKAHHILSAVHELSKGADGLAEQADQAALAIEYEKYSIVLSVLWCCVELAAILVASSSPVGSPRCSGPLRSRSPAPRWCAPPGN